ncbi:MAG: serine/threonine-protein kinase [Kofleriaceae bacterium]
MTSEGTSHGRLGTYELVRPLAQGGMANIYLARRDDDQVVAVKVLNDTRASDSEACSMFLDEARVVALLSHPNIAGVLDVNVSDEGKHYLAMEYVNGVDLRELLAAAGQANRKLPYETAIAIVMSAAAGLDHAHRRCGPDGKPLRLVHRDVSLSNIMVGHDGIVKVVDFGIATTTLATVHTSPGVVRGKASYMSPEQCLGDRVDHRTDVFALGIVLYELATGARCFAGKSDFDRMLAVVRGDYILPRDIVADVPVELEQVIRCALSIDAGQRYDSAAALIEALDGILRFRGWTGGTEAIRRTMAALFATQPAMLVDDPAVTERHEPVRQRLARGTESDLVDTESDKSGEGRSSAVDDQPTLLARGSQPDLVLAAWAPTPFPVEKIDDLDDQLTRGRRTLRRPASAPHIRR